MARGIWPDGDPGASGQDNDPLRPCLKTPGAKGREGKAGPDDCQSWLHGAIHRAARAFRGDRKLQAQRSHRLPPEAPDSGEAALAAVGKSQSASRRRQIAVGRSQAAIGKRKRQVDLACARERSGGFARIAPDYFWSGKALILGRKFIRAHSPSRRPISELGQIINFCHPSGGEFRAIIDDFAVKPPWGRLNL